MNECSLEKGLLSVTAIKQTFRQPMIQVAKMSVTVSDNISYNPL